jgi:hypothetical protein
MLGASAALSIDASTATEEVRMKSFDFTIIATGVHPSSPGFADRFFEAGCDDATLSFQKGVIILEFAREARSFAHALASAARDVRRAGARVERVEPDYLVSLSDIAKRSGLTRAAVSLYSTGERGRNFPAPVARVMSDTPLWDWYEVARWMYRQDKVDLATLVQARLIKEMNVAVSVDEIRHVHLARKFRRGVFETA